MKSFSLGFLRLLIVGIACSSLSGFAQVEKITIPMVPAPNQTVRMKMIQDIQMDVTMDGNAGIPVLPGGGMKMQTKNVSAFTQKVGPRDAAGLVVSEVTFDESSVEMSLNGQPMPNPNGSTNDLTGKKITVTQDKEGKTVDVKLPADLSGAGETMTGLMKTVSANLPLTSMAIGEVVTAPLDMAMPIPIGGGAPLKITGVRRYKLVSIDKDSDGARIARFDVTTEGSMVSDAGAPSPIPGLAMNMNFTVGGSGTMFQDLDKGVIKSSETKTTLTGKMKTSGGAAGGFSMPDMTMQGIITQTITRAN